MGRGARRLAAVMGLALVATTTPAAAQEAPPASAPRTLCLNGGPAASCTSFLVLEVQGVLPLLADRRTVRWHGGYEAEESPYADRLQWELGLMRNVSERWAVGGTARLGPGSTGALTGLAVRARRWISPELGLDLSTGATFLVASTPGRYGRATGFMADARLNFDDDVYAGLRYERVRIAPYQGSEGTFDPGGSPASLSLLLGLGSEWAIGGSAALGLALTILLATVDWS